MKIYALMVIYNKSVSDSPVYKALMTEGDVHVIVCDNSTETNDNRQITESDGGVYVGLNDNGGLARAYNAGIRRIFEIGGEDNDYVCIFDDDSIVESDYFAALRESIFRDENDIFLPVVEDDYGIMSPAELPALYCRRIKNTEELLRTPRKRLTGINSGMAVRLKVYRSYSYDERFFMDYIDHNFILEMREKKIYPKLMDAHVRQNFSAFTDDAQAAGERFARQRRDLKLFYEGRKLGKAVYYYVVIKKKVKLALKYKKPGMLFG